ncbi:hypothetical protein FisN_5Hh111 [Fistulifera solaris]|uniref:TauD/TfdA-like domain-containing protein n=1 Tax=Fistulifera solaris TaxID=1519565 RepID=A0A1Z5JUM7_FISSO|nr:hypothetical protein FisN_5Hh111 [Fistulifera solaris]|eukprot:GAX17461.1 hypothetical protein FisN_5Hh111 [Fistulifera solaris]
MKLTVTLGVLSSLLAGSSAFVVAPQQHRMLPLASSVAADQAPPLSPLTLWGERISDIRKLHQEMRQKELPEFAPELSAVKDLGLQREDVEAQLQYVKDHAMEIKTMMQKHGAVIFRDFDLMKTQDGFQQFYSALGMKVCLDPLHSVSARPTVDGKKNSPVYEAVNKESRKNFFIGMHNEFVGTRAPRAAAFVCFKAAETGGEFLVADGRRLFRDLDADLVEELYNRQIRYSVMELPFFGWIDNLPGPLQNVAMGVTKGLVTAAINAKVDFDVDLLWGEGGYDNTKMLQARAPSQPPIVIHPVTQDPTWFCNVHSHSSKLRKDREAIYGAERFEDGASQINKSDMFYGDDGELTDEQLKQIDEVTMKNVKFVKMTEGDVVLLDNYKTMHGRNVFDGTRKHGVAWFEGWEGEEEMKKTLVGSEQTKSAASKNLFFADVAN